jgi:uncharacterized membrane protein
LGEVVFWVIIAALIALAIPIGVLVLFARTGMLRERISLLERKLDELSRRVEASSSADVPKIAKRTTKAAPLAGTNEPEPTTRFDLEKIPVPPVTADAKSPAAARITDDAIRARDEAQDNPPAKAVVLSNGPTVLGPDLIAATLDWLRVNWIYVVSAVSLGLAGIFFVQYGMERGLLPPGLRVLAAIAFGAGLIGAGEWIRRRYGDEGETSTIHLPSVFSGAGVVTIFAATLAARHLYGLITPEVAFAGHLITAALAVLLGWFYGPLLAAVGLVGAALAPFIVDGGSGPTSWLYAYFALISAVGHGIDAFRRWAWVSVLALILGYATSFLCFMAGAGDAGWIAVLLLLPLLAVIVPRLSLMPGHPGPYVLQTLLRQSDNKWPIFPVRLAAGATATSSFGLLALATTSMDLPFLAPTALVLLTLAYLLWAEPAEGLSDLALLPGLGFLVTLVIQALAGGPLYRAFQAQAIALRGPETNGPLEVSLLLGMAVPISAAAAWRALSPNKDRFLRLMYGLMAVLAAPLAVAILELLWNPAPVMGTYPWALHVIAIAALATALALRFAKVDHGDMQRTAHAVLAALSLIALALFLLTSASALTLSLAVLVVVAAWLDRRFNLPEMGLFQQIATAVVTWRLLMNPGLEWALEGPLLAVIVTFAGACTALIAARLLIAERGRVMTIAVLESAAAGLITIFANVLITRALIPEFRTGQTISHWQSTLSALPWLVLMLAQLYRAGAGEPFRSLRHVLAGLAGIVAGSFLLAAAVLQNPLFAWQSDPAGLVKGPPILDSLFLAYAVPGLILLLARRWLPHLAPTARMAFMGVGAGLLTLYAGLEIRRLWQGTWLGSDSVSQGELYTYTLAMMVLGAGLLYQAIRLRSALLRRVAMVVIGVTIAKVFFLDAAGLTGLTRVFSFLGLGLSLAGLAWINRWAGEASAEDMPAKP